jgi:hypothetical protein
MILFLATMVAAFSHAPVAIKPRVPGAMQRACDASQNRDRSNDGPGQGRVLDGPGSAERRLAPRRVRGAHHFLRAAFGIWPGQRTV